jgi:hypothetical protein
MEEKALERPGPKKGVVTKIFGVILVFLGTLDSMLSWRGGFEVHETYALLIVSGIFLYAVGAIKGGKKA